MTSCRWARSGGAGRGATPGRLRAARGRRAPAGRRASRSARDARRAPPSRRGRGCTRVRGATASSPRVRAIRSSGRRAMPIDEVEDVREEQPGERARQRRDPCDEVVAAAVLLDAVERDAERVRVDRRRTGRRRPSSASRPGSRAGGRSARRCALPSRGRRRPRSPRASQRGSSGRPPAASSGRSRTRRRAGAAPSRAPRARSRADRCSNCDALPRQPVPRSRQHLSARTRARRTSAASAAAAHAADGQRASAKEELCGRAQAVLEPHARLVAERLARGADVRPRVADVARPRRRRATLDRLAEDAARPCPRAR